MGVVKNIVILPFKLAWGLTKFTGKVAINIADALLTGYINKAEDIMDKSEEYNEYSDDELKNIVINKNSSNIETVVAANQLKHRQD